VTKKSPIYDRKSTILKMRTRSLSRVYQTCYPLAVTRYVSDEDSEELFDNLQQDRLDELLRALDNTLWKQVVSRFEKVLEVGQVLLTSQTAAKILKELVFQGEREPYGVRGGTLVVLFRDRLGKEVKMGRFPLDSYTNSTFEMHLTLVENSNIKVKVSNLLRKVAGLDELVVLDNNFKLEKRKLYRSSQ